MAQRIAIIDDDAAFLELLSSLLAREGYEARLFEQSSSSAAAYEQVRTFMPDIIVLDIALEHPYTGWRTLNLLKLDPELGTKPLVVCSNDLRRLQEHTWYLKAKGCEVLPKPFFLNDLLTVIGQIEVERL